MLAIRGAITAANTREDILKKTKKLFREILVQNSLVEDDIISVNFSATRDLTAVYPALALREIGFVDTPLFCVQEMYVEKSLEKVLRVLIYFEKKGVNKEDVKHIYLDGAKVLRPDISGEDN